MRPQSLLCALCLLPGALAAATLESTISTAVEERLQSQDIPGAVMAVVRNGDVLLLAGFGYADPQASVKVQPNNHLFRVGSVSKPVTATLALLAAQAAGVDVARSDMRPRLAALPIRPALNAPLTLHHLLTHTAGFNERLFGQHTLDGQAFLPLRDYLSRHLPPRFIDPGEVIAYNDHHTALAAYLVEEITGQAFADLARATLFEPLSMTSSTFAQVDVAPDLEARIVSGWRRQHRGWRAYPRDFVQLPAAAGLATSASDMARYMMALLDCRPPLTKQICDAQLTTQFRHHPQLPGRAYGFAETEHGAMRVLYKDGQVTGFNARIVLVPEAGLGLFVAHNRTILGPFGAMLSASRFNRELTRVVLDAALGDGETTMPHPAAHESGTGKASAHTDSKATLPLSAYVGTYRTVVAARHTWERLVSLFDEAVVDAEADTLTLGQRHYAPAGGHLFRAHAHGGHIAFRVKSGQATHLFIGAGAYERIPDWLGTTAHLAFVGACIVLFLAVFVYSVIRSTGIGFWLPATNACWLIALGSLGAVFYWTDPQDFFKGAPATLLVALVVPLVGVAGLAGQIVHVARHGFPERWMVRPVWALNLLLSAAFLAWLQYWRLLGYQLG